MVLAKRVWENVFSIEDKHGEKTPAQTRRFSSEHRWNVVVKVRTHPGLPLFRGQTLWAWFQVLFQVATSGLAYFHWAAEGKRSTTKWKPLQVHKEEKRPCILAHTATVIMTSPDYDLYFWATDNNI